MSNWSFDENIECPFRVFQKSNKNQLIILTNQDLRSSFASNSSESLQSSVILAGSGINERYTANRSNENASVKKLKKLFLFAENSQYLERNFTVRFRCLLDNTSGFLVSNLAVKNFNFQATSSYNLRMQFLDTRSRPSLAGQLHWFSK